MDEKVCGTCKRYQPATDFEECGVCTDETLWSARNQEVMADLHACADLGSHWEPLATSEPSPAEEVEAVKSALPGWVPWLRWAGGIGLALSPGVFFIDLFIGIPGVPELFLLWFLFFAGVTLVGFIWGKI